MERMCWLGQVSRTGYYRHWRKVQPGSEEIGVRDQIHALVFAHRAYGYRRVTAALRQRGWAINHKRVARLMRLDGLQAQGQSPRKASYPKSDDVGYFVCINCWSIR